MGLLGKECVTATKKCATEINSFQIQLSFKKRESKEPVVFIIWVFLILHRYDNNESMHIK